MIELNAQDALGGVPVRVIEGRIAIEGTARIVLVEVDLEGLFLGWSDAV